MKYFLVNRVKYLAGKVSGVAMASAKKKKSKRTKGTCPNCSAEKTSQIACTKCGYEFSKGAMDMSPNSTEEGISPTQVSPSPPSKILEKVLQKKGVTGAPVLQAVLIVDTRRRDVRPVDEKPPAEKIPKVFVMETDCLGFGRTAEWMQIPDTGVSRNHGEFVRQEDGSYCVRDIGSVNGIYLNGKKLAANELHKIKPGDELMIGFWHIIQIHWGHN